VIKIGKENTSLGVGGEPETSRLREAIARESSELFDLGSGCLAWQTNEGNRLLFYDPQRVVIEFFVGGGSTTYSPDPEHVHRMVIDSDFSRAEYKRNYRLPHMSSKFANDIYGTMTPMEVPFPLYIDPMCVIAWIQEGNLILPRSGSAVPHLERASDIADIVFVKSALEPTTDKDLEAFLFGLVPKDRLTEVIDSMSHAYILRKEAGPAKPYEKPSYLKNLIK